MPTLISPCTIGDITFRNRIAMAPMVRGLASMPPEVVERSGKVTPAVVEHYARRARAGCGLIIVEATAVDPAGRVWQQGLNAWADEQIPDLARLAAGIRAEGAVAAIQLVHGGPQASPQVSGATKVGPSKVLPIPEREAVHALTVDEILAIEQRFADAAARAVQAGFQAVEIHGAHGYLLDSFLLQARNRRTDAYGGSLAGRLRFLTETCLAVRERVGPRVLVDCRVSIFNHLDEGFGAADLAELVRTLAATGLDLLHFSTNGALRGYFGSAKTVGQWARESTDLPIIVAGRLGDPRKAAQAISEGHADFAAIGLGMLQNPDWALRAREMLISG